jgi:hypothetical protein
MPNQHTIIESDDEYKTGNEHALKNSKFLNSESSNVSIIIR